MLSNGEQTGGECGGDHIGAEHPHLDWVGGGAPAGSGGAMACRSRIVISVGVDGKPKDVSRLLKSSLAHLLRTCSSESQTPMMYSASLDVAQWCRNSPNRTAPPRRMISACPLSYASFSLPTSPSNPAISTTGMRASLWRSATLRLICSLACGPLVQPTPPA